MSALPILPVEIWRQILGYLVTPKDALSITGWKDFLPVIHFPYPDFDVKGSLARLTAPATEGLFFRGCIAEIWRLLISRTRWVLIRTVYQNTTLVQDSLPHHRKGVRFPFAQDLEMLQTVFGATVKHVEVFVEVDRYFKDGQYEKVAGRSGKYQWAWSMMDQVLSALETCKSLSSLRLYFRPRSDFDSLYRSRAFRDIWEITAPTLNSPRTDREDGKWEPMAEWKAHCEQKVIDFRIIARRDTRYGPREDSTEFWDLPEHVFRDEDFMRDIGLEWAIGANAARRPKVKVETELPSHYNAVSQGRASQYGPGSMPIEKRRKIAHGLRVQDEKEVEKVN